MVSSHQSWTTSGGEFNERGCREVGQQEVPAPKRSFAPLHLFTGVIEWRLSPTWLTKAAVCPLLVPQSKQNRQVPNLEPEAWSPGLCLLLSCRGSKANRCEEINQTRRPSMGGPFCSAWKVQPAGPAAGWRRRGLGSGGHIRYSPRPLSASDGIPGIELAS